MKTNFKDIWTNQGLGRASLTMREPLVIDSDINCFAGIISASNAKMFQIELDRSIGILKITL